MVTTGTGEFNKFVKLKRGINKENIWKKNKRGTKIGKFKFGRLNVERYNFELKQIMEEMTTEKNILDLI